jgi:hypothetical protein
MNAEKHFQKGARFERTQAKLELADDWETIIEACYMASHHYIEAGAEWLGVPHPQAHAHRDNISLLKNANAPSEVQDSWRNLELLRPGSIYGSRTSGTGSTEARDALKLIKEWAEKARPSP